jgi:SpoVK/Ycf46/Vps4 family AAA+-type ATPase
MVDKSRDVFVIATTTDPGELPSELISRFEAVFFIDVPTRAERAELLSLFLEECRVLAASLGLNRLSDISEGFSVAQLKEAVLSAAYEALHEGGDSPLEHIPVESAIRPTVPLSQQLSPKLGKWCQMVRDGLMRQASNPEGPANTVGQP